LCAHQSGSCEEKQKLHSRILSFRNLNSTLRVRLIPVSRKGTDRCGDARDVPESHP
jgi:hypothetical protein